MRKPKSRWQKKKIQNETNKQNKTIFKLEPAPEPMNTTSIKILDYIGNKVKERTSNDRNNK